MKVLDVDKSPLNIQKCLLPDCEFLKQNYGRYCAVSLNNYKFIVKIGLYAVKNIHETLFLDKSVLFSLVENSRTEFWNDITFDDFSVLGKPRVAKNVKVQVVFVDVFDAKKYAKSEILKQVLKDILKLFVFSADSTIFLFDLTKFQNFNIFCLKILEVNNSKSNQIFNVDFNTEIKIEKCISQLNFEQFQKKETPIRVGGCKRVYEILKEAILFSKCLDSKNIKLLNKLLLIGPSGCGKATLVRNVTSDCSSILVEVSASIINILSPEEMEKKLINIFEEAKIYAENKESCVILIEDVDAMSSGKSLLARRFIGQLITLLEEVDSTPGLIVVATTSCPEDLDSQLRRSRRLEDELEIMVPTMEERIEILEKISSHCKMECSEDLLQQVAHWTPGFVGADLKLLFVEALMILRKIQEPTNLMDPYVLKNCFKQALTKVIPSALRGAVGLCTAKDTDFSQIGGLEEVKKSLDILVKQQLENPWKFQKFGIPLTKGILLYGPPGCAKTSLVKALAKECNMTFLATSAADLYSPFVGDAEKKIVQLFAQARIGSPSILFFDEIDAVVGSKSGDRERGVQERILSTLLIEMDGVGFKVNTPRDSSLNLLGNEQQESLKEANLGVIVIGATNRPQLLDDALKRPGRFDRLLYVPPPDESERLRILQKLTEKMPLHNSVDLSLLAKLTNHFSGADLKNLCQEAGLHAMTSSNMTAECIQQSHFEHVLTDYKPSLNEKIVDFYESFQKYNV